MNNINFNDMFSSFPKMSEMMNDMSKAFGSWDGNENTITFTLKSGKTVKISEANDKVEVVVDDEQYHYTSDTKPKSNYCYTYTANNPPKPYAKEEKKEKEDIEMILRRIEMTLSVMRSEKSKVRWALPIIGILNLLMWCLVFATIICG